MAAGLMILAAPVVRLAFERGVFTAEATAATSVALVYAAIGIPFTGLADLASKAFYATHDTLTPVFVNVGAVGVNVALSLALVGSMQHAGLSLAASCQPIASFIILQAILRRRAAATQSETRPSAGGEYSLAASLAKSVVAAAVMWAAVSAFDPWFAARLPQSGTMAQAVRLAASVGVGVVIYFGMAAVLRSEELSFAAGAVRSRLDRGKRAR
jgi:putative peptidoglycan lipid II flippase